LRVRAKLDGMARGSAVSQNLKDFEIKKDVAELHPN
jgi:hypothetical protein